MSRWRRVTFTGKVPPKFDAHDPNSRSTFFERHSDAAAVVCLGIFVFLGLTGPRFVSYLLVKTETRRGSSQEKIDQIRHRNLMLGKNSLVFGDGKRQSAVEEAETLLGATKVTKTPGRKKKQHQADSDHLEADK